MAKVCLPDNRDALGIHGSNCRRRFPGGCGWFVWTELFYGALSGGVEKAYHLTDTDLQAAPHDVLVKLTKTQGFGEEFNRMAERLIFDARQGKLGRFTLEKPGELDADAE